MDVGDVVKAIIEHGDSEILKTQPNTILDFRIIKIYPNKKNKIKDIMLCEHVPAGYKKCFYRMDLERWNNDKQ